jgi:hypothetical protein
VADVGVVTEDTRSPIQKAETGLVLTEARLAACLLLKRQGSGLGIDRSWRCGSCADELDDSGVIVGGDGDVRAG